MASMDWIRFFRMSDALARLGHTVDIIVNRRPDPISVGRRLREVPFRRARWDRYDLIKTFFHTGFESLLAEGGGDHPFILSKLGSVVGREQTPGVHFFGRVREQLFETQTKISRRSRWVTVLTKASAELWTREHGTGPALLEVPTGVEVTIPPPGPNPYRSIGITGGVAIFAGNLYSRATQPEVNRIWQDRLNLLGHALRRRGLHLVAMGTGETDFLDPTAVIHVGPIDVSAFWDWQRYAGVGVVLAQGPIQDNESSKIYYYLRAGLPVVCERPVPNACLIEQTGHGRVVDHGDVEGLAEAAATLSAHPPPTDGLVEYIIENHSWDVRAAMYRPILAEVQARQTRPWSGGRGQRAPVVECQRAPQSSPSRALKSPHSPVFTR
jgi:hypothetical protein